MKRIGSFPMVMTLTAIVTFTVTMGFIFLYHLSPRDWILSVAISTGTTFYHFAMRLLVGVIVPPLIKQPRNRKWFHPKAFEPKLYAALHVKYWKDHMPTFHPRSFSLRHNSLEQIWHNCCVSEAVHEVIILFSFIPLLFSLRWGTFPVFLITSALAAAFDCSFVIIQRYNRPRLLRILEKKEAQSHE